MTKIGRRLGSNAYQRAAAVTLCSNTIGALAVIAVGPIPSDVPKEVIKYFGGMISRELGIDLSWPDPEEVFKWFLASLLFGARISDKIARRTYKVFVTRGLTTPASIEERGLEILVSSLDIGGYARYDFKTAKKIIDAINSLMRYYDGDLNNLHATAKSPRDLEKRIKILASGIGGVTVSIFLRELRGIWKKADPPLDRLAHLAARKLGLTDSDDPFEALRDVRAAWEKRPVEGYDFRDFEAALVKLGRDLCKRGKCSECPVHHLCREPIR